MTRRSYDQYCSMATALDVVGERWTLLIVRELMLGPRRFTDLLEGLPGIGGNLLSARLRHMEAEGLVRRRQADRAHVYELTEDGAALGPTMAALGRWGVARLGPREPRHHFNAAWAMFPLSYMASPAATRGLHEVYEFRVDEEVFHLRIDDGAVIPRAGAATDPDLVATMDTGTLSDMMSGAVSPLEAVGQGRVRIDGSPEALAHALALWPPEDAPEPEGADR